MPPPGTQVNVFSFDHTTGLVVSDGTATVSEDGQYVVSDPGSGIRAPGWHFVVIGSRNFDLTTNSNGNQDYAIVRLPLTDPYYLLTLAPLYAAAELALQTHAVGGFLNFLGIANGPLPYSEYMFSNYLLHGDDVSFGPGTLPWEGTKYANIQNLNLVKSAIRQQINSGVVGGQIDVSNVLVGNVNVHTDGNGNQSDDMVGTINGTEGVSVSGTLDYVNGNYVGDLTFTYKDVYGWGTNNTPVYYLQYFGLAKPFKTTIGPIVEHVSIPAPQYYSNGAPAVVVRGASQLDPQFSTEPGFGTSPAVYYRFETETGFAISGKTDANGALDGLVFPPNVNYVGTFYQPSTNRWTRIVGTSSSSGAIFGFQGRPTSLNLENFGGVDSDGDGIPDVGELAIGTDPNKWSTTGDGISDSAKIAAGLDPLDGRSFPTGIVASLPIAGSAQDIAVAGSTAYIAAGSAGLAIVDVSLFNKPILLAQLPLPGTATDVATLAELGLVAVADNNGGLQIVNVSIPTQPVLVNTLSISANRVVVADGFAYASAGGTLFKVNLISGDIIQSLGLGGGAITGIAADGSMLYTMSNADQLQVVDISSGTMVARGSLNTPVGGGDLFVGNGIAYVADLNSGRGGYATVDVSNSDNPVLISGSDAPNLTAPSWGLVSNGSGLGLLIGQAPRGPGSVRILDISDPTNTYNQLLEIPLPDHPYGITIASGIAFIADGTQGLQIINYLPFDNRGNPPSVTVSAPGVDVDPTAPGVQVVAGSRVNFVATTSDDVQVRSVELLLNGQVVDSAETYPWSLSTIVPNFSADNPNFVVQVRATDTGGNVTLSDPSSLILLPDTTPPTLLSLNPVDGSSQLEGSQILFGLRFSEPIVLNGALSDVFQFIDSSGTVHAPDSATLFNSDEQVKLAFANLAADSYQLVIHAAAITDRAGNPLGDTDITSNLTLTYRSTLSTTIPDADPNTPGMQVYEGTTMPFSVGVAMGVKVKKIELLVNGTVVATSTLAPAVHHDRAEHHTGPELVYRPGAGHRQGRLRHAVKPDLIRPAPGHDASDHHLDRSGRRRFADSRVLVRSRFTSANHWRRACCRRTRSPCSIPRARLRRSPAWRWPMTTATCGSATRTWSRGDINW